MKKKILFVNGHMNVGGVEKTLLDLINNIDYNKYDIDLLLIEELGDYISSINKNINVIYKKTTNIYGPFILTLFNNFKRGNIKNIIYRIIIQISFIFGPKCYFLLKPFFPLAKQYDYAIAYRHGECANIVAYVVNSKRKFCWWHHGECNFTQDQIENSKKIWKHFKKIVTVSEGCQKMMKLHFPIFSDRIITLPNMVNINQLNLLANTHNPYKEKGNNLIFVTIGRLYIEKHIENVVDVACQLIKNNITNFKWYIIGDGELYNNIQEKISNYNLEKWITMLGSVKNPYPYIKYADVLVHTSYIEAQCTTMLESMALKTPCVITKTKNPQDFTVDKYNCFIAEQNINSLTNKLIELINNPILQKELIINAEKTIYNYSPPIIITKFETLINCN